MVTCYQVAQCNFFSKADFVFRATPFFGDCLAGFFAAFVDADGFFCVALAAFDLLDAFAFALALAFGTRDDIPVPYVFPGFFFGAGVAECTSDSSSAPLAAILVISSLVT